MTTLAPVAECPGKGVRRRRILIVDDNVDAAVLFGMLLREEGHDVSVAHEGLGALETAASFLPEVVLLDLAMPGMNGIEVASRLRQQPLMKGAFLVAVSGYDQFDLKKRCLESGFDAYLLKPVRTEDLSRLLSSVWPCGRR